MTLTFTFYEKKRSHLQIHFCEMITFKLNVPTPDNVAKTITYLFVTFFETSDLEKPPWNEINLTNHKLNRHIKNPVECLRYEFFPKIVSPKSFLIVFLCLQRSSILDV